MRCLNIHSFSDQVSPEYLHPHLSEFLNSAAKQLVSMIFSWHLQLKFDHYWFVNSNVIYMFVQGNQELFEFVPVANNACWAIGELAVKVDIRFLLHSRHIMPFLAVIMFVFLLSVERVVTECHGHCNILFHF